MSSFVVSAYIIQSSDTVYQPNCINHRILLSAELYIISALAAYAFKVKADAQRINIVIDEHHENTCGNQQINRVIRKMNAPQKQAFEAEKPHAEEHGKEGCFYYYLQYTAVQFFYVKFQYAVVAEAEYIWYHGKLVRYDEQAQYCGRYVKQHGGACSGLQYHYCGEE